MKLEGIQIGRAVAALSVLYFHSWTALVRFPTDSPSPFCPLARLGELGVDLFFGISGFVICLIAAKPGFRPVEFLTRRVFRIYPLWLLCLGVVAILFAVWRGWQNNETYHETLGYLLYSATLLPTRDLPFYNIGWTLQHEMAFYFLAAIIVPMLGLFGLLGFLILSFLVHLKSGRVPCRVCGGHPCIPVLSKTALDRRRGSDCAWYRRNVRPALLLRTQGRCASAILCCGWVCQP